MKLKSVIALAALLAVTSGVAQSATITLARGLGAVGINVQNGLTNAVLPGGYYIAVGTFTNASGVTQVPTITTDFSSLLAAVAQFDVFGSSNSPTSGTTSGLLAAAITGLGSPDTSVFNNKEIFVLVGNGTTAVNSNQWGFFSMATPVFFPPNVADAGGPTLTTATFASITPLPNAGTRIDNASGADSFRLVGVPEPSAAMLGAIGALGLLRRRRN